MPQYDYLILLDDEFDVDNSLESQDNSSKSNDEPDEVKKPTEKECLKQDVEMIGKITF